MIFLRLMLEGFVFALNSLVINKLRTFLSLLGITIGIFAIITIFTIVDSLESKLRTSVASLGENVIFVQKWPWGTGGGAYPWWKYLQRPEPDLDDFYEIQRRCETASACAFLVSTKKTVKYKNNSIENADVVAVSHDYDKIKTFELRMGRYFTGWETESGKNITLIGEVIAYHLFGRENPIGKMIKLGGTKATVIGVFKYEGEDIFEMSPDYQAVVPVQFAKTFIQIKQREDAVVMVKAIAGVSNVELMDDLRIIMRSIRKLKPLAEDNFALNEITLISNILDDLFSVISLAGWIIGGFSILVGGFGIANIMFVSVRERTGMIGIQKSIGARNSFILVQFLFESVVLCLIGGLIGLLLVFAGTLIINNIFDFEITLTIKNILLGLSVSALIGIISGFVPAYTASQLNPVEAIRKN